METIYERARTYFYDVQQRYEYEDIDLEDAFIEGAESEHSELTKWNRPDCPPEHTNQVLAKVNGGYQIAQYFDENYEKEFGFCGWIFNGQIVDESLILGWREIHE